MKASGAWLSDAPTQAVLAMLSRAGHQALCVGGCVRDALIGRGVADVDIATDARPEAVVTLAKDAGLKAVPTGIDHGTVTVVAEGRGYEVTTFRRDVETFGRHAVIAYADRVEEDAARRDFTMNALYARADGTLVDPLGGLADLVQRRVRFVGPPADRIREDYLRILRFFRFQAHFGDPFHPMDPDALAACAAHADGIGQLSRERVGAEIRKLLAAPDPSPALRGMAETGVLEATLRGPARALGALLVLLPGGRARGGRRGGGGGAPRDPDAALRLTRAEARDLARIVDHAGTDAPPAALGYWLGAAPGADAALLRAARARELLPEGWASEVARGAAQRFPLRAADLMPALSGPALGRRLRELEWRWVASDFRLTRAQLLT
ncbi:MAG: CCA tRNA nucleotidyltransferase [Rhodobacteraceae bacterium]|nr:CCA tRNA nucleotidyltransferase [Paracoccaceae bacterium]